MECIKLPDSIIFILVIMVCFVVGEGIIIFQLLRERKKEENKVNALRNFWGPFIIYVIATSIIALFIASFVSKNNVELNDMNTWVSLILGMVALIIGIISLFLSFYNVDQSVQAQKETIDIIQRFKEDMIDRMHQLQKDIENKIEVSNKETREELNGKLNQPLENRVKEKPKSYSWEDEE